MNQHTGHELTSYLAALHEEALQVGGHGEAQLVGVLQQQPLLSRPLHLLLHELITGCTQACITYLAVVSHLICS